MHLHDALFLFCVAVVGGALNSVAGGGGFLCFPALIFTGMPPINANATNTAALWPGTAASTAAYRSEIAGHGHVMLPLIGTGIVGGLLGALVLLRTPQATFLKLVPWLLLTATLLLAFSGRINRRIGTYGRDLHEGPGAQTAPPSRLRMAVAAVIQLAIGIYIGFFGAGAGILMMAMFAVLGVRSIHATNGLKTLLATVCNGVALVTFIIARAIVWPQAALMIVGASIGGYGGAWYAQKLPQRYVRGFAIVVGASMTVYFFVKTG
ncbi:MAG: sulfite exporter TauE/SafE family protein [Terriglobales bacterium]